MNKFIIEIQQVGSTVTCNPPVLNTDEDWIVLTSSINKLYTELQKAGFVSESDDYDELDKFYSFRKGKCNLIVTENKEFYDKFLKATYIAKYLNLLKKQDRIDLFQAVLYQWEV